MSEPSRPITRTDQSAPFFQTMQREMNQFLDRFRQQPVTTPGEFFDALSGPMFPALDVVETEGAMEITAEVPGVSEEDLDISIAQNTLILKGEKSNEHEETKEEIHVFERRYGSFRRHVPLGFTPDEGAVSASFSDGVLKISVAKPESAKSSIQKIKISKS